MWISEPASCPILNVTSKFLLTNGRMCFNLAKENYKKRHISEYQISHSLVESKFTFELLGIILYVSHHLV